MKDLYTNVEFYEKIGDKLVGPIKGIRFTKPADPSKKRDPDLPEYKFCQIMDGKIVRVFTDDEMVAVDKTSKQ